MPSINLRDRIYGAFAGFAMGDALGSPHEFAKRQYTGTIQYPIDQRSRWHGIRAGALGGVSDDTEMMLALANSIVRCDVYDESDVLLSYATWANSKCPFLGNNTRSIFVGVKTEKGIRGRIEKIDNPEQRQSNGSLMRALPLFIYSNNIINADCNFTNPNSVNRESSRTYLTALYELLCEKDPREIWKDIRSNLRSPALEIAADQIDSYIRGESIERDMVENRGWVVHAWYCAMRTLVSSDPYHVQIDWIIGQNPGSDTDTNAAIAGGLLGMKYGLDRLLRHPTTAANWDLVRESNSEGTEIERPPEYHPRRFPVIVDWYVTKFSPS